MTREENLIRLRREARQRKDGRQSGKSGFITVLSIQILVCFVIYGGIISMKSIDGVNGSVDYYLSHTVDYTESLARIGNLCRSCYRVMFGG